MDDQKCPKCGAELKAIESTPSGKKLQRCSAGNWNSETKQAEGCTYVKWINDPPQELDEKCPKCGAKLVLQTTRFGKKMKKCSAGGWDKTTKTPTGCDYIDWMDKPELLEEECPQCGEKLVLQTTSGGKKLKKCSTAKWDSKTKTASGCTYVEWQNPKGARASMKVETPPNGDEKAPDFEF
jgi:ssDNA-binding Zn-finger/Zn-ribbon topoisomerase 1